MTRPTNAVVIFDLDDTLFLEAKYVFSAFKHIDRLLVADYDLEPDKANAILTTAYSNGLNPFDELNKVLKEDGIVIPNAIKWMVNEYRFHVPFIKLSSDVSTTLSNLKEQGVTMFIITDGRSITQRNKIRALNLDEFFDNENIFISEELGFDKTNPKAINNILKRYSPNEYTYFVVGDNPAKDFYVANSFGLNTVMLIDDTGTAIHSQKTRVPKAYKPKQKVKGMSQFYDYFINYFNPS